MMSVMKVALTVALVYALLVAVAFVLQRRMLYLPTNARPSDSFLQATGLAFWPAPDDYRGLVALDAEGEAKGTIIVFHGNAGRAADRSYYAPALAPQGYRVVLAEYPGYGGRPGRPSEAVLVADAKETVELVHRTYGEPIYLWGESLGSGVVAAVAAETSTPIAGLALITPWDSLPKLAQDIYWFFPARWLVLDQYDNAENLQSYGRPVAVVVAGEDEIIPVAHSMRSFEAAPADKRLWVLEGAGHNSWPVLPEASWWREVVQFLSDSR